MRISMTEPCFPDSPRVDVFSLAAQAGAEGVELFLYDEKSVQDLRDQDRLAEITGWSAGAGVAVSSLCLSAACRTTGLIRRSEATAPAMEMVLSAVRAARTLGTPVVLLPYFAKSAIEAETELDFACDRLVELAEQSEEEGVVIGVESTLSMNQKIYLSDHTGGVGVKHYYDVGNVLMRKLDPATELRELGSGRVCQVHFKDVVVREGQPPMMDVLLGGGQVNFLAVCEAIKAIQYDGWVCLETPALGDALKSAKNNVAYARKMLGM